MRCLRLHGRRCLIVAPSPPLPATSILRLVQHQNRNQIQQVAISNQQSESGISVSIIIALRAIGLDYHLLLLATVQACIFADVTVVDDERGI